MTTKPISKKLTQKNEKSDDVNKTLIKQMNWI